MTIYITHGGRDESGKMRAPGDLINQTEQHVMIERALVYLYLYAILIRERLNLGISVNFCAVFPFRRDAETLIWLSVRDQPATRIIRLWKPAIPSNYYTFRPSALYI